MLRRIHNWFITLVLIGLPVTLLAQNQLSKPSVIPSPTPQGFLESGHLYHIRFSSDPSEFVYSFSEVAESYSKLPDGTKTDIQPVQTHVRIRMDIFRVVQFDGGSWVLVEYPASPKDFASWEGEHRATLMLEQPEKFDAAQLARLKEASAREIKLTRTWINLDQALTIKPVSRETLLD